MLDTIAFVAPLAVEALLRINKGSSFVFVMTASFMLIPAVGWFFRFEPTGVTGFGRAVFLVVMFFLVREGARDCDSCNGRGSSRYFEARRSRMGHHHDASHIKIGFSNGRRFLRFVLPAQDGRNIFASVDVFTSRCHISVPNMVDLL